MLRAVVAGSRYFSEYGVRILDPTSCDERKTGPGLSRREKEVLKLVACGRSSKEIANELFIALSTIEHYRTDMMRKLDIHEVASLTRYAVRMGMVSVDEDAGSGAGKTGAPARPGARPRGPVV